MKIIGLIIFSILISSCQTTSKNNTDVKVDKSNLKYSGWNINSLELKRWDRWMKIGGNRKTGEKIYYGRKTYVDNIGYNYIWIMRDFKQPFMNKKILSLKTLVKVDCQSDRYQILGTSEHMESMAGGLGKVNDYIKNKKWKNFDSSNNELNQVITGVLKILCSRINTR